MKTLQILFVLLINFCSCTTKSESDAGDNQQEEAQSDDTLSDKEMAGIDDEFNVSDEFLDLTLLFGKKGTEITEEDEGKLHANPENRPVSAFLTKFYQAVDDGHLFVYSASHGASDLYYHQGFYFAYFDINGNFLNTEYSSSLDEDIEIEVIQNKFLSFKNTYDEYVENEEGFAFDQTDERITEYTYFVFYPHKISPIKNVDPSEWPFLRNRLFARHGYIFQAEYYSEYFSAFDWYEPKFTDVDHLMSPEEKKLADYIKSLEDARNTE